MITSKKLKIGNKVCLSVFGPAWNYEKPKKYIGKVIKVGPCWYKIQYRHKKNGFGQTVSEVVVNKEGKQIALWSSVLVTKLYKKQTGVKK
jgi:hypothetical protein